ncbi:penicillin-binding protein 2 [Thioflexithrix psekupsensis]|uniref:penicillin-binding protein 2 n=1 Tax=Thioflexithrix psekupsensis TaxID=1570016 RepID=UPI001FD9D673|nr:penicillin-binding protein 2 [Thioflexithrix psekupsensis]
MLKDAVQETRLFSTRVILGWMGMLLALSFIVVRLVYLQVVDHERYTTLSESNRLKILPIPPTRGFIFDRNGVLLAENRASYRLELIPERIPNLDETINDLRTLVHISEEDVTRFRQQMRRYRPFDPVPLRFRLTEDEVARFSVQSYRFKGVGIESDLSRYYPLHQSGAHIIGYVGRISEEELKVIDPSNYRGTNYIGKTGVEKSYERYLHGQVGYQEVETDVRGRVLRVLARKAPAPGKNLYLNIDMALQSFAEELIRDERAAIVAIDPQNGAVLALVSMPSYDLNLFVGGIDAKTYKELRDSPDRPLYNRAIRGQYPPGSTIKSFVGLAGLEYGIRTEHSRVWCSGAFQLKGQSHRYRDWKRSGHGSVNFHTAVEQSCDVYFYDLAHDLGIDRLHTFMTRFKFGQKTGIDLVGELSGLMPSREWKRRARKAAWYPGETVITGIGQGYMLATPLQLAVATATLSMHGQFLQPRVAFATEEASGHESEAIPAQQRDQVLLKEDNFWVQAILGMEAVIYGSRGTARKVARGAPYRFAGKTGTAQVFGIKQDERYNAARLDKRLHDHAWFVAFAPVEKPRIAIAVIVENGGGGSSTAAPIAREVMDFYLLNNPATLLSQPATTK